MPSLSRAVLLSIVAATAFILASDIGPKMPVWLRFILVSIAFITTAGALVEAANWLAYIAAQRAGEFRRLQTLTPVMEILRMMTQLSPQAQIEMALQFGLLGVDYRVLAGTPEPSFSFHYDGHRIPYDFIAEFFSLSTDRFLPAVRQWTEGSHKHMYADALTAYLVKHHYALPAKGVNPAAWLWEGGRKSLRYRAEQAFGVLEGEGYAE